MLREAHTNPRISQENTAPHSISGRHISHASKRFIASSALIMAAITAAPPVSAQDKSLESLLQCDKIKNEDHRLTCFNAVVTALKSAKAAEEKAQTNAAANKAEPDGKYTNNSVKTHANNSSNTTSRSYSNQSFDKPQEVIAAISKYWKSARGYHTFLLDNGQIWRAKPNEGTTVPQNPQSVHIKKGIFGGYRIEVKGQSTTGRTGKTKRLY